MRKKFNKQRGFSTLEYLLLMAILLTSFFSFKDTILRAIAGKWKATGDQFGHGRQFNPADTVECVFDSVWTQQWYDVTCYENHNCPPGNDSCQKQAITKCQAANDFCAPQKGDLDYREK